MAYDAREYLKALKPPTYTDLDGEVHVGKILSHHQMAQNQAKLAAAAKVDPSVGLAALITRAEETFREVLGTMFEPEVVEKVMALPPEGVQEAMADFLASQRRPKPAKAASSEEEEEPAVVGTIQAGG